MKNKCYIKHQLTLQQQLFQLKKFFNPIKCSIYKNELIWIQKVQPTPLSKTYDLTIKMKSSDRFPKVYLYNQKILQSKDDYPKHCYKRVFKSINNEYVQICLFLPGEWRKDMLIANTIIPWAIEWLYFYELWRITGKWLGGGHEFEGKKK